MANKANEARNDALSAMLPNKAGPRRATPYPVAIDQPDTAGSFALETSCDAETNKIGEVDAWRIQVNTSRVVIDSLPSEKGNSTWTTVVNIKNVTASLTGLVLPIKDPIMNGAGTLNTTPRAHASPASSILNPLVTRKEGAKVQIAYQFVRNRVTGSAINQKSKLLRNPSSFINSGLPASGVGRLVLKGRSAKIGRERRK